jgi:hypothetical protein
MNETRPGADPSVSDAKANGIAAHFARLRVAAVVAHKGPHDSDATMLRAAAVNLTRGYEIGGSNVKRAVSSVLSEVASIIEHAPETLAAHDAEVEAKVLTEFAQHLVDNGLDLAAAGYATALAARIRVRAE